MKVILLCITLMTAASMTACSFSFSAADSEPEAAVPTETAPEIAAEESSTADEAQLSAAFGKWESEPDEDGLRTAMIIRGKNEVYHSSSLLEEDMYFDENRNLWLENIKFTSDPYDKQKYEFADGILSVKYNGKYAVVMEKTDDSEDVFGEYTITGGQYLNQYYAVFADGYIDHLTASMSENRTVISIIHKEERFELTADHITRIIDGEVHEGASYRIEGDKMIMMSKDGEEKILTRAKE